MIADLGALLVVLLIAALFAGMFILMLRETDALVHEQCVDELWDDDGEEVGADALLWASSGIGAGNIGDAA